MIEWLFLQSQLFSPEPVQRIFSSTFSTHFFQWSKGTCKTWIYKFKKCSFRLKTFKDTLYKILYRAFMQLMNNRPCLLRGSEVHLLTSHGRTSLLQVKIIIGSQAHLTLQFFTNFAHIILPITTIYLNIGWIKRGCRVKECFFVLCFTIF